MANQGTIGVDFKPDDLFVRKLVGIPAAPLAQFKNESEQAVLVHGGHLTTINRRIQ